MTFRRLHEFLIQPDIPRGAIALQLDDGATYSYAMLDHLGQMLAARYTAAGLRAGDRLLLVAENSALFVASVMACSRLDAWFLPVNARMSIGEIAALRAHAQPRLIHWTQTDQIEGAFDCGPEPTQASADQCAALMYTTGTTSAPKGVMLSHANLIANASNSSKVSKLTGGEATLLALPCTHIFGFASVLLAALRRGAAVRMLEAFKPDIVLDALSEGAHHFPAVPQMWARLLAHLDKSGRSFGAPNLRLISSGGAPLDPDLKRQVEALTKLPLNNGYGLTECAPSVAVTRSDQPREDISVGQCFPNVEVRIDKPNEDGVGEVWIKGPTVMLGYYRDAKLSSEVLVNGWYKSGDLGKLGTDSALFIVGRLKELIIRSGFNVYPPEVEAMLTRHERVREAAVVGRAVPGNEEILAFVVGEDLDESELRDWLKQRLVAYKVPQRIIPVNHYPVAATGKILKQKLIAHFKELL